jgi:hypothetical protein
MIEHGLMLPSREVLKRLADAFRIYPPEKLLELKERTTDTEHQELPGCKQFRRELRLVRRELD